MATALAETMARIEGWYKSGSVAQRNNNPGCLTDFYTGEIKTFATPELGWIALEAHIQRHSGLSLEEYLAGGGGYAGYDPGNVGYPVTVGKLLGVPISSSVASLIGQQQATAPNLYSNGLINLPSMQFSEIGTMGWIALGVAGLAVLVVVSGCSARIPV